MRAPTPPAATRANGARLAEKRQREAVDAAMAEYRRLIPYKTGDTIRHPSYLGLLVNSLGWALAFRSGVGVLLTVLLIPPLLARIRAEERMLRTQFGSEYDFYCTRTSRLIPTLY
jgi:protein-S-isoprenylcysteine O-methyltransferase Ste14